jgi:cell wall-associated NlpC family hydrolase
VVEPFVKFRPVRILIVATTVGMLAPVFVAGPAPAAPIDDLQAQAAKLQDKIDKNGEKIAELGEALNAAQLRVDEAEDLIAAAEDAIVAAEAEIVRLQDLLARQAAALYVLAGSSNPLDTIHADDVSEAGARSQYAAVTSARDEQLIADLDAAQTQLEHDQGVAEEARAQAETERAGLAEAKDTAEAAAARQQGLLNQVTGEIAELVAAEAARRAAALAAAAPPASSVSPGAGGTWDGPVPDPIGGGGAAAAFAQAQVGKAYVYAAAGPDAYDCSGLTMRAWQAGGLSLPHYSGAQYSMFAHRRVPLDQLQPGDLITTSSWPAHIGIWVGGGYVHASNSAPYPQGGVKYVAGYGSIVDAVRPG